VKRPELKASLNLRINPMPLNHGPPGLKRIGPLYSRDDSAKVDAFRILHPMDLNSLEGRSDGRSEFWVTFSPNKFLSGLIISQENSGLSCVM
jgi:hypothetical protein